MAARAEFCGCSFAYKLVGEGEPVVLIQGVGLHGDGWLTQTEVLRSRFQCLTFDNRGMGQSQLARGLITIEQMALDTLAVMDAAGLQRPVHVVGHSMGGAIAQARSRDSGLAIYGDRRCRPWCADPGSGRCERGAAGVLGLLGSRRA